MQLVLTRPVYCIYILYVSVYVLSDGMYYSMCDISSPFHITMDDTILLSIKGFGYRIIVIIQCSSRAAATVDAS